MFTTPILFLIFNRPEVTYKVFQEIKNQKPKFLFIAADGPRNKVDADKRKCKETRDIVLEGIDWDCEVKTLFRKKNLGCGKAVSSAINWFFENVEQGIILEDDCFPERSFFNFCDVLLEKYKYEEQVYAISGDNFHKGIVRGDGSYYFSHYAFVWGWATWRRAWMMYDYYLEDLNNFKNNNIIDSIDRGKNFKTYWYDIFEKVSNEKIDTWDYQWIFTIWNNKGKVIVPNINLISNIGFGKDATHTTKTNPLANLETFDIGNIRHPKNVAVHKQAHKYDTEMVFNILPGKNLLNQFFSGKNKLLSSKRIVDSTIFKKKVRRFIPLVIIRLFKPNSKSSKNINDDLINIPRFTRTKALLNEVKINIPDSASFLFMHKEIFEQNIYKFKTDNPRPYIIDGGANIGLASIYFKFLYPDSQIVAFEPDPVIFDILKSNIGAYNFNGIELIQKGLWNENTNISFKSEGADAGLIASLDKTVEGTDSINVISLQPYLKKTVDFLKLDIEGAETVVLKDIENDLDKVERIFVEYHSFVGQKQTLNEIIDILTKANFRLHVSSPGIMSKSPFIKLNSYNNMDMQLNIYGVKEI